MSLTPFEHLFLSGLFGDAEIAALLSTEAEIVAMLRFEAELAAAQAAVGIVPAETAGVIIAAIAGFMPDMAALRTATGKDGVVVPELVRQLRHAVGEPAAAKVHFGATSQDVIDTALMLRLKSIGRILGARLENCLSAFAGLEAAHGGRALTGFTRMQAAIPITVTDRIRAWRDPLVRDRARLSMQEFAVQFGGAAGTLDALGDRGPTVRAELARRLDLADRPQWQSQRDGIAGFAGLLSLISGSLGKFGQDIALMAEIGTEIRLSGGGGSSAMAHKQNPVTAELLVALARFNAVQLSGLHQALVHEQERSGAAWMLEWMLLPPMLMATGRALGAAAELIGHIDDIGKP